MPTMTPVSPEEHKAERRAYWADWRKRQRSGELLAKTPEIEEALDLARYWAEETGGRAAVRQRSLDDEAARWQRQAACNGMPEGTFFPEGRPNTREVAEAEAKAKAICAGCPVRLNCLEYAIRSGEEHGVWGGVDGRTLKQVRRVAGLPRPIEPDPYAGLCGNRLHPVRPGAERCEDCQALVQAAYRERQKVITG